MQFEKALIEQSPYPIAWACYGFNNAFEHVERFLKLATLFERFLRFMSFTAVSAFIRDKHLFAQEDVRDIKTEVRKLERPTLGCLYSILAKTLKLYRKKKLPFPIPEMAEMHYQSLSTLPNTAEACKFIRDYLGTTLSKYKTLLHFFELMIIYRNNTWGHGVGQIGPDFAEQHSAILYPALHEILNTFSPLFNYPIGYIERIDVHKSKLRYHILNFSGLNLTFAQSGAKSSKSAQTGKNLKHLTN